VSMAGATERPDRAMLRLRLQPKQAAAFRSRATELLYGGAAGGGKSHLMRAAFIAWCLDVPGLECFLFRRTYPDLMRNHMEGPSGLRAMLAPLVAAGEARIDESHMVVRFAKTRASIHLCHCQRDADVTRYQGAQMHVLGIDELTHFSERVYRFLRSRVRLGGHQVPERWLGRLPRILCSANPGGIGHSWVRRSWIEGAKPWELRQMDRAEGGMVRQYIPALLEDNPAMMATDPHYEDQLMGLGSPELVRAMRWGEWDIFAGQMFALSRERHVVEALPVPDDARLLMTYDWGFGAPFSVGWWWVDGDGRLYRHAEWYGAREDGDGWGGLRLTDDEVAEGIIRRERELGIWGRPVTRLAGHDCAAPRPRYEGGGQSPSTAETFAARGLSLLCRNHSRRQKIRQFHARLRVPGGADGTPTGELPMLVCYPGCEAFLRTIPALLVNDKDPEDIDSEGEDHGYDEACLACMEIPLTGSSAPPRRIGSVVGPAREVGR